MDPHQMNDTPPCPHATPEWMKPAVEEILEFIMDAPPGTKFDGTDDCVEILMEHARHAPTAPRPTTDYAGLVERLEALHSLSDQEKFLDDLERAVLTDAIAALTQLAGEVERLKKFRELHHQAEADIDGLRAKLAASEANAERKMKLVAIREAQLAAAKLDADALAEALEILGGYAVSKGGWSCAPAMARAERALEAHRARGAAGGKKAE